MLLEGFFEGVGGLAFAFEVFGEVLLVGWLACDARCHAEQREGTTPGHRL